MLVPAAGAARKKDFGVENPKYQRGAWKMMGTLQNATQGVERRDTITK